MEICECSLTAGNYPLSYTNINCRNAPEARDGYFTTYYSFNKIILDVITEKFDIQVDENTKTQATLLHNDIPGYDLPTIDSVQTSIDDDEDVSILEEDNLQIYTHLDNVLVHMIDNQQTAIFKSNQDFNKNKEKILQYIKYAENWQVMSVMCSYAVIACDVLLIVAMIVFLLKYRKTMQAMLAAFLQMNTKNTGIQSVQADQIGRTYPLLFTLNLPKDKEIIDDLREITAMEYVVQIIMIIVCIAIILIVMYFCCTKCIHTHTIFKYCFPFLPISHIVRTSRCTDLFVEVTNVTKGNGIWAHFVSTGYFPSQIQLSRPIHKDDVQIETVCCICRASARLPASQSTAPHFPSSFDEMRNRKAQTGLIRLSAVIKLHPLNRTRHHFCAQSLSQSEAFPPLSPRCSDIDNEHDITLHIKASASAHSWHFVLGLGSEHLLGS